MLKFIRKFIKRKDGATAIEFSFLLMPYTILSLGIVELSLMFTAESLLEGSTSQAARQIRTGQIQTAGGDMEAAFKMQLCGYARVLIRCEDVVIESRVMDSFSDYSSMQPTLDEDGNMVPQGFDPGGSSDRLLIRVAYRYQAFTPLVGQMLWGADNSRNFMSTIVLQSEPYDFEAEIAANGDT